MADKGIIFSAAMVRALLDGRKTQTRRLLKPQPCAGATHFVTGRGTHIWDWPGLGPGSDDGRELPKVRYAPGDRLYVREAWSGLFWDEDDIDGPARELWATPRIERTAGLCSGKFYREDEERKEWPLRFVPEGQWQPSIHMPRWASRLTLLVSDVRVQRVGEISETDARAEGVSPAFVDGPEPFVEPGVNSYVAAFADLWNSLHNKPGERWEDSPWIVAVSFSVVRENIDRIRSEAA